MGVSVAERRSPGRPKDLGKRATIVAAARALFFRHGVDGVSMDAVAQAAGVSKMTVYASFKDKGALFVEMVRYDAEQMELAFASGLPHGADLRQTLILFGEVLVSFLMRPDVQSFDCLFATATVHYPDLAERFFANGPGRMQQDLCAVISSQSKDAGLMIDDPRQAAEDLASLWLGMKLVEIRYGKSGFPSAEDIRRRVEHGVNLFFKAYGKA